MKPHISITTLICFGFLKYEEIKYAKFINNGIREYNPLNVTIDTKTKRDANTINNINGMKKNTDIILILVGILEMVALTSIFLFSLR